MTKRRFRLRQSQARPRPLSDVPIEIIQHDQFRNISAQLYNSTKITTIFTGLNNKSIAGHGSVRNHNFVAKRRDTDVRQYYTRLKGCLSHVGLSARVYEDTSAPFFYSSDKHIPPLPHALG